MIERTIEKMSSSYQKFNFFSQVRQTSNSVLFLGKTLSFSLVLPSKLCSKASLKSLLLDSFFTSWKISKTNRKKIFATVFAYFSASKMIELTMEKNLEDFIHFRSYFTT